jgi:hypothetical protein
MSIRFPGSKERSIEAKHSIAKKRLTHNSTPSAPTVSLALRLREVTSILKECGPTKFADELARDFTDCKHMLILIGRLGLSSHPLLCDRLETHDHMRMKDVTAAMYHHDLESTFLSHTKTRKQIEKRKDKLSRQTKAQATAARPANEETLLDGRRDYGLNGHLRIKRLALQYFQAAEVKRATEIAKATDSASRPIIYFSHTTPEAPHAMPSFFSILDPRPYGKQIAPNLTLDRHDSDCNVGWSDIAVRPATCHSFDGESGIAEVFMRTRMTPGTSSTTDASIVCWSFPDFGDVSSLLSFAYEWHVRDVRFTVDKLFEGTEPALVDRALDMLVRHSAFESSIDAEASRFHILDHSAHAADC